MRYAGIIPNDVVDSVGGFAVSFWVQGCPFHCKGCHNPQTWDYDGGEELPNDYYSMVKQLLCDNGIQRNLSVLGGEPLCRNNLALVRELVQRTRADFPMIKIFLWTGFTWEVLMHGKDPYVMDILKCVDVLVDGQFIQDKRNVMLPLRGSSNQRVIDVSKSLDNDKVILWAV